MSQWIPIAKTYDLKPGEAVQIPLQGRSLALFQLEGEYYIIDDACSHAGGSLAEGAIAGDVVTCPWHGATFDIRTGESLSMPAHEGVAVYKVRVTGDDIEVEI